MYRNLKPTTSSVRYERHIFICVNEREPGHRRGCCLEKGAEDVRARFKQLVKERGLKSTVRANAAGCLDICEFGVSAVVYPEGVWYGGLTVDDVEEIVDSHLIGGEPVKRLLIQHRRYTPAEFLDPERVAADDDEADADASD